MTRRMISARLRTPMLAISISRLSFLPPHQLLAPPLRRAVPRHAICSLHLAPTAPVDRLVAMSGVVRARKHVAALVASRRLFIVSRHDPSRAIPVMHGAKHVDLRTSQVFLDGSVLPRPPAAAYFLFQKPAGCITTRGEDPSSMHGRPSVMDVVRRDTRNAPLIETDAKPVGRLDCESEGLLLFSNDGIFAKAVLRPEMRVPKRYLAVVRGRRAPRFIDRADKARLQRLKDGVKLGNSSDFARAESAEVVSMEEVQGYGGWGWDPELEDCVCLTLCEGKFREVRRMMREIGFNVLRLRRVAIGDVEDPVLHFGLSRRLSEQERKALGRSMADGLPYNEICDLHWR